MIPNSLVCGIIKSKETIKYLQVRDIEWTGFFCSIEHRQMEVFLV